MQNDAAAIFLKPCLSANLQVNRSSSKFLAWILSKKFGLVIQADFGQMLPGELFVYPKGGQVSAADLAIHELQSPPQLIKGQAAAVVYVQLLEQLSEALQLRDWGVPCNHQHCQLLEAVSHPERLLQAGQCTF